MIYAVTTTPLIYLRHLHFLKSLRMVDHCIKTVTTSTCLVDGASARSIRRFLAQKIGRWALAVIRHCSVVPVPVRRRKSVSFNKVIVRVTSIMASIRIHMSSLIIILHFCCDWLQIGCRVHPRCLLPQGAAGGRGSHLDLWRLDLEGLFSKRVRTVKMRSLHRFDGWNWVIIIQNQNFFNENLSTVTSSIKSVLSPRSSCVWSTRH